MGLKAVPKRRNKGPRNMIPAKQLGGVENPATVLLIPVHLGTAAGWWTHDDILIGGIAIGAASAKPAAKIGYLPTPVPRSWGEKQFGVVIEYEAEKPSSKFRMRVHYGCGDPSELHLGESNLMEGVSGGKRRMTFKLKREYLARNELFRATLEVVRETPEPILVYGAWIEVGV